MSKYTNGNVTVSEVLSFAWHPRAQYWFLYSLFFIFLLGSFFYLFIERTLFLVFVAFLCVVYLERPYFGGDSLLSSLATYSVFFAFGVWFNEIKAVAEGRRVEALLVFAPLFLIGQFVFHSVLGLNYRLIGFEVLVLALISIFFIVFVSMCAAAMKMSWLVFIGSSSMSIYLMHILVGSGARVVLRGVFGVNSISVHLLVGTLFGVCLPLLAQYYFRRYGLGFLFAPPTKISVSALIK